MSVTASEDELRRGKIPTLNLCIEDAVVEGVRYDRLLLVMHDVLFTSAARGIVVHSHGESHLSGGISKETFLKTLSEGMPHFAVSELALRTGSVMIKGVYERRLTFKVRALMRFTGSYVIDGDGVARVRFDDARTTRQSARSMWQRRWRMQRPCSPSGIFRSSLVREVLVDHDMVWFSARESIERLLRCSGMLDFFTGSQYNFDGEWRRMCPGGRPDFKSGGRRYRPSPVGSTPTRLRQ